MDRFLLASIPNPNPAPSLQNVSDEDSVKPKPPKLKKTSKDITLNEENKHAQK